MKRGLKKAIQALYCRQIRQEMVVLDFMHHSEKLISGAGSEQCTNKFLHQKKKMDSNVAERREGTCQAR